MQQLPLPFRPVGPGLLAAGLLLLAAPALRAQEVGVPLDRIPVPLPANLDSVIRDREAALVLGKALFWDEQVGSDGRVACATCHFASGADNRITNTVNPGPDGVFDSVAPGGTLTPDLFPFRHDDVVGSQGVISGLFHGIRAGRGMEIGTADPAPLFGLNRQVTGRNTPSAVNAIFTGVNFWDGRAANLFNGVDPGGQPALVWSEDSGGLARVALSFVDASLASQATGPPRSSVEMAWAGRQFPDIGKKVLTLRPLARQDVDAQDSLLGRWRHRTGRGLRINYRQMISRAFDPRFWNSNALFDASGNLIGAGVPSAADQYTLMESNFTLFWGLSILVYESTLVSDDSKWDRVMRGEAAFTAGEALGARVFEGDGRCDHCHVPPTFTAAATGDDRAFAHIGVRPAFADPGRGNGEFKTSSLRNVELTAPYFHTGGYLTLRQVVDFYNHGGDFPSGAVDSQVRQLGLTDSEAVSLVEFLLTLTDERVRHRAAPFDGPSLNLPSGAAFPATGQSGGAPLQPFLGASPFAR